LRLLYKIKPEERALPTEDDLATRREGERYEQVARSVRGDVGAEWRSLARRVWSSAEGERIVGALLKQTLEREVMAPAGSTAPVETVIAKEAAPPEASAQPEREAAARPPPIERERRRERGARSERPERGGRADRPERGGRGRRGERREARDGRGERGRGEKEKERERERGERSRAEKPVSPAPPPPPAVAGAGAPAPEPRPARPLDDEREFWEAWVDERNVPESPGRAEPSPERAGEPSAEPPAPALEPGMARLYLNLGRRDRVRAADVQQMVAERTGLADVKLQVRNTHTYLIVREADVQSVISALHGTRYSERDLVCEPAKKS